MELLNSGVLGDSMDLANLLAILHTAVTVVSPYSNQALLNQDSPPASADDDGSRRDLVRGPKIL